MRDPKVDEVRLFQTAVRFKDTELLQMLLERPLVRWNSVMENLSPEDQDWARRQVDLFQPQ